MSATRPYFTVGIPTFNRAELLRTALQQLLLQSHADFEIIVADNASPDHTQQVVESFKDPRVTYVRHSQNIGALKNFLSIVAEARGEFVIIHQDDDFLHREFLKRCYDAVQNREDVVMYATPWWRGNPASGFRSKLLPDYEGSHFRHILNDEIVFLEGWQIAVSFLHSFHFAHPTIALRMSALKKTGGYFPAEDTASDVLTEARVLCEGILAYDPRPGGIFTDHGANASRTMEKTFKVQVYEKMYRQLLADFEERSIRWKEVFIRDLATYEDRELLRLFAQWARYHAPKQLQDAAWTVVRSRKSLPLRKLIPRLLRKVGIRNLFRFWLKR